MSRKQSARNEQTLQQLREDVPGNNKCADCGTPYPSWASSNLGIFLCMRCAGIHRKLGSHISKIKSPTLDSWSDSDIEQMKRMGNRRSNQKFAPDPADRYPPLGAEENDLLMERFIREKYRAADHDNYYSDDEDDRRARSSRNRTSGNRRGDYYGDDNDEPAFHSSRSVRRLRAQSTGRNHRGKSRSRPAAKLTGASANISQIREFANENRELERRGFRNIDRNIEALTLGDGRVREAVEILLADRDRRHFGDGDSEETPSSTPAPPPLPRRRADTTTSVASLTDDLAASNPFNGNTRPSNVESLYKEPQSSVFLGQDMTGVNANPTGQSYGFGMPLSQEATNASFPQLLPPQPTGMVNNGFISQQPTGAFQSPYLTGIPQQQMQTTTTGYQPQQQPTGYQQIPIGYQQQPQQQPGFQQQPTGYQQQMPTGYNSQPMSAQQTGYNPGVAKPAILSLYQYPGMYSSPVVPPQPDQLAKLQQQQQFQQQQQQQQQAPHPLQAQKTGSNNPFSLEQQRQMQQERAHSPDAFGQLSAFSTGSLTNGARPMAMPTGYANGYGY